MWVGAICIALGVCEVNRWYFPYHSIWCENVTSELNFAWENVHAMVMQTFEKWGEDGVNDIKAYLFTHLPRVVKSRINLNLRREKRTFLTRLWVHLLPVTYNLFYLLQGFGVIAGVCLFMDIKLKNYENLSWCDIAPKHSRLPKSLTNGSNWIFFHLLFHFISSGRCFIVSKLSLISKMWHRDYIRIAYDHVIDLFENNLKVPYFYFHAELFQQVIWQ